MEDAKKQVIIKLTKIETKRLFKNIRIHIEISKQMK